MDLENIGKSSNENTEIYAKVFLENLEVAKISKVKKGLFKVYAIFNNSWDPGEYPIYKSFMVYVGGLIKHFQLLFLVLQARKYTNSYTYEAAIQKFLKFVMIDNFVITEHHQVYFTNFLMIFNFTVLISIGVLTIQVIYKKKTLMALLSGMIVIATWVLYSILFIPMLIYSFFYIQYSFQSTYTISYYQSTLEFSPIFAFLLGISSLLLSIHLFFCALFLYNPQYSTTAPRSRGYSEILIKNYLGFIVLSFLYTLLPGTYFLSFSFVITCFLLKEFIYRQPFYSFIENYIEAGFNLSLCTISAMCLLDNLINLNNTTLFCYLFIMPILFIILYWHMKKVLESLEASTEKSPYAFEFKLRKKLYKTTEINEDEVEKMFAEATENYLEFRMFFVWECCFFMNINLAVAATKLLKMNYSQCRPEWMQKPKKVFHCFLAIESEYFSYMLLKRIRKSHTSRDMVLIKYLINLYRFVLIDYQLCINLLRGIDLYIESKGVLLKDITNGISNFYSSYRSKELAFEKNVSKYGNDKSFMDKNFSFRSEILTPLDLSALVKNVRIQESFMDKLLGNNSSKKNGILIVSGFPSNFGKIIYANNETLSLLSYPSKNLLFGKHINLIIPSPFKLVHDMHLLKALMYNSNLETARPLLYVVDYNGNCLQVAMSTRIVFYAEASYFFIELIEDEFYDCFALCSSTFEVYSFSVELKNIIHEPMENIEKAFPYLQKYIENYREGSEFIYAEFGKEALMKWENVRIGEISLKIVYFLDPGMLFKFKTIKKKVDICSAVTFQELITHVREEKKEPKPRPSMSRRRIRKFSDNTKFLEVYFQDYSVNILRLYKVFSYSLSIAIVLVVLAYMIMAVISSSFINDKPLAEILANVLNLKYNIASLSLKIRTLDLYYQGVPCFFTENTYMSKITENLISLQSIINDINSYDNKFNIKKHLETYKLPQWSNKNGISTKYDSNLYQAIIMLIANSFQVVNSDFTDKDSLLNIYQNSFVGIYNGANFTNFQCLHSIKENNLLIIQGFEMVNWIGLIPIAILIIIIFYVLYQFENINCNQWESINAIPKEIFLLMRSRVAGRINRYYLPDFEKECKLNHASDLIHTVWKEMAFKAICAVIVSIVSYLLVIYMVEYPLNDSVSSRLDFMIYGDKRAMFVKAFSWVKEGQAGKYNTSYVDLFDKDREFSRFEDIFESFFQEIKYFENLLLLKTLNSQYDKYFDFLVGDTCKYVIQANCSKTIISHGVHQAINEVLQQSYYFVNSNIYDTANMLELEHSVNIFENILNTGLDLMNQAIDNTISLNKIRIQVIATVFSLASILLWIWLKRSGTQIKNILLSKNEFIGLFKEASQAKTEDNPIIM